MKDPLTDRSFGLIPIYHDQGVDQFLLIQHQAGHWGFPKGHAEADESAIHAAQREFEEETGIQDYQIIDAVRQFTESYQFRKNQRLIQKTVIYFLAQVQSPQVVMQVKEIRDYAWLSFDLAYERLTFQQAKQLLIQVNHYLNNGLTEAESPETPN